MHDDQALSQDALGVGPSASNRANAGQHDRPSIFRGFRRLLLRVPEPLTSPSRSGKNFSTFLVSLQVIIVPLFILVQKMGMVNTYAGSIIPVTFNAFGIFLLRQFYLGIPIDLQEAAIIDGASYWGIYWNIMLPLSRPILSALAVFFFLVNGNAFFGR